MAQLIRQPMCEDSILFGLAANFNWIKKVR